MEEKERNVAKYWAFLVLSFPLLSNAAHQLFDVGRVSLLCSFCGSHWLGVLSEQHLVESRLFAARDKYNGFARGYRLTLELQKSDDRYQPLLFGQPVVDPFQVSRSHNKIQNKGGQINSKCWATTKMSLNSGLAHPP